MTRTVLIIGQPGTLALDLAALEGVMVEIVESVSADELIPKMIELRETCETPRLIHAKPYRVPRPWLKQKKGRGKG